VGSSSAPTIPGVLWTHLAIAIADGADCLADIAALKDERLHLAGALDQPSVARTEEGVGLGGGHPEGVVDERRLLWFESMDQPTTLREQASSSTAQ
jgi:hypothetical protein